MKQLKDTIAQLKKENVDLKVETIIQQKIIESHADHSESESYNCEKCDFECDDEDALETHNELFHEDGVEVSECTTDNQNQDDKIFPCNKCHLKFKREDDLKQNKQVMHCSLLSF